MLASRCPIHLPPAWRLPVALQRPPLTFLPPSHPLTLAPSICVQILCFDGGTHLLQPQDEESKMFALDVVHAFR